MESSEITTTNFDKNTLDDFDKDQLVQIIIELQKEKNVLHEESAIIVKHEERLIAIERSHFLYQQYGRRESIEIVGIPENVIQNDLEKEVINVYKEAGVLVHGNELTHGDISACHRIGKKNTTIVRFVNRKWAMQGLFNGKKLKGTKLYGNNPVFINNSFCWEFKYLGYAIRKLKTNKQIDGYKIKHGVYQVQTCGSNNFEEISHVSDFSYHNLDISAYPRFSN